VAGRTPSTGDFALPYSSGMRSSTLILSLSLFLLACGDDAPTRPKDGTVKAWQSCVWDGQIELDLCESGLGCTNHGVCAPVCESIADCPTFEGFTVACSTQWDKEVCMPKCNEKEECPKTGGVELHCLDFFCEGDL
jgi:hypothetical protein